MKLQPQPVRLLDLLVSRAGELVTREELRDALWPDGTSVEFDQGLNFSVRQIRAALGESASNPVFLETLPKRGYRFIGQVTPVDSRPATESTLPSPPEPRNPRAHVRYWVAAVAVAALGLSVTYWLRPRNPDPPKTILIRPLRNLGLPAENAWYADSLTERLILAFSRYISVRGVPGPAAPQTEADVIIDGSLRKVGNSIEVTIQVQDTRAERPPWSKSYTFETANFARIEKQIADSIADAFRLQIQDQGIRAASRPPEDIDAYNLYLRAIAAHDDNGNLKAVAEALEEVIRRAPKFAPAYADLANVWARAPGTRKGPHRETFLKALEHARKAVLLDPQSALAHGAVAHVLFKLHKWPEAEHEFRVALNLDPNSPSVLQVFAIYLTIQGHFDEGIEHAEHAARLAPTRSLMAYTVALAHLHAGHYDEVIAVSRRALRFGSGNLGFYNVLSRAYAMKGMIPEAHAMIDEWEKRANAPQPLWRALVLAQSGDHAAARARLHDWDAKHPERKRPPYPYALTLIELGESDRGFQALRAVVPGEGGIRHWVKQTPELKRWHDDPRFRNIVEEFNREPSE